VSFMMKKKIQEMFHIQENYLLLSPLLASLAPGMARPGRLFNRNCNRVGRGRDMTSLARRGLSDNDRLSESRMDISGRSSSPISNLVDYHKTHSTRNENIRNEDRHSNLFWQRRHIIDLTQLQTLPSLRPDALPVSKTKQKKVVIARHT
jgi:hypothetical protein